MSRELEQPYLGVEDGCDVPYEMLSAAIVRLLRFPGLIRCSVSLEHGAGCLSHVFLCPVPLLLVARSLGPDSFHIWCSFCLTPFVRLWRLPSGAVHIMPAIRNVAKIKVWRTPWNGSTGGCQGQPLEKCTTNNCSSTQNYVCTP